MSQMAIALAQFIYILWPLFIAAALIYSLQIPMGAGRGRKKARRGGPLRGAGAALSDLGRRIRHNLLFTWTLLLAAMIVSAFAPGGTPGLIPEPWNTAVFLGGYALLLVSEAGELGLFHRRVRARVAINNAQALQDLKAMDPYDFEELVAETYRELGYQARQVGRSGDHGVDVAVRTPAGDDWIVQCKRYRDTAGESIVRELYGTMVSEGADRAVLVTTAEITHPARAWAEGKPIDLIDGPGMLALMQKARDRADGTVLDRIAHTLDNLLLAPRREAPPALRKQIPAAAGPANGTAAAVPPAIRYSRGAPVCPRCRMPMRPFDPARGLYRCRNYPTCRVTLPGEGMRNAVRQGPQN